MTGSGEDTDRSVCPTPPGWEMVSMTDSPGGSPYSTTLWGTPLNCGNNETSVAFLAEHRMTGRGG